MYQITQERFEELKQIVEVMDRKVRKLRARNQATVSDILPLARANRLLDELHADFERDLEHQAIMEGQAGTETITDWEELR